MCNNLHTSNGETCVTITLTQTRTHWQSNTSTPHEDKQQTRKITYTIQEHYIVWEHWPNTPE